MAIDLEKLQQQLNYQFSNHELVTRALTHRSANKLNNERLEFLGDALLGFIVAETLFKIYPNAEEGELSRNRASLVKKESLAEFARELGLGEHLQLGMGELNSGGRERDSILADAVEAIIAAIYLDGGTEAGAEFVRTWCERVLSVGQEEKDCKTRLQEFMQAKALALPNYKVVKISGEAHQQMFHVSCQVAMLPELEYGDGRSKRIAEQRSAEKILQRLGELN